MDTSLTTQRMQEPKPKEALSQESELEPAKKPSQLKRQCSCPTENDDAPNVAQLKKKRKCLPKVSTILNQTKKKSVVPYDCPICRNDLTKFVNLVNEPDAVFYTTICKHRICVSCFPKMLANVGWNIWRLS